MSLKFKCPKCRQVLSAGDSAAGKVARCKHCQAKFRVPTPKASLVAKPDPIPQAARPVPPHATGPTKTGPAKTAPTTTTPPLAKRATPSAPDLPPASPASTDPASTNPDDPFGDLPDFQSFEQPIAKPVTAVDPLHQAMSANSEIPNTVSPAPTPSQSSADTKAPTASSASIHDNLADAISGIDDTVSAAVAAQQQRNAAAIAPKVSVAEIQAAFRGEMADFDRDVKVKGRLALVAFAMIVLPIMFSILVIVASIMVAVWPLWWLDGEGFVGSASFTLMIYPLIAAFLIAAWIPVWNFMLASLSLLFSKNADDDSSELVTPETQPVLYEFVSQICQKVGAPPPAKIYLDCDFNASASSRGGWLSAGDNNLVLTLGIPLIACQSGGQLASVVAHEFGHFRQGSAMRSSYLVRSLTGWFINSALYGHWRAKMIEHYQDSEDADNALLALFSMLGYLGRQMMWSFGYAGHALAGTISREMEYDADRHAAHLAGTQNFIDSMGRVERYGVAHAITIENLKMLYHQCDRIVDNIPRFMMHIGKTMPAEVIRRIAEEKQKEKQQRMDTHPPTRDRVAAAQQINQLGILQMQRPASDLVRNWKAVCESNTRTFYSQVLDRPITVADTTKLEDILSEEHKLLLDNR